MAFSGEERGKELAGQGSLPLPGSGFAGRSRGLNKNKCKTDRYICNLLPHGLYETLNLLARGGRQWLPEYFFLK